MCKRFRKVHSAFPLNRPPNILLADREEAGLSHVAEGVLPVPAPQKKISRLRPAAP
jgi:hypothetical protein